MTMSADEYAREARIMSEECSDEPTDYSVLCECEGGKGPNCDGCVKQLAEELAACIDSAPDTVALAEACVRAKYAVPRRLAEEQEAARALKKQLHALWRDVVGTDTVRL